ncbi:MAG TPA: hypothetical protein VMF59_02130 [Bacteroidota bacterium]|nr:hypothetical protein [Bacteroidota bacterium]
MPLEEAMAKALPLGPGENHHRLFLLARWVRSVEAHEGRLMPAEQYRNVFDQWFARNDFLRPDQTRDEYWLEFAGAYKDVRLPLGAGGPLEAAWRAALSSPPPGCASQFTDQKFILLVSWCRELQRLAGDKPFYLSCRTVQQRLGLPTPPRAGTILRGLVAREILDLVDKGTHRTGMASSYRYLPPLDE